MIAGRTAESTGWHFFVYVLDNVVLVRQEKKGRAIEHRVHV